MKRATKKNIEPEMRKEYDFSKGQRGRYAERIKPGDTDLNNIKVRVTLYLDGDIIQYFKDRAARADAAPYQTQINNELRRTMQADRGQPAYSALIEDEGFLSAVADKLTERLGPNSRRRKKAS